MIRFSALLDSATAKAQVRRVIDLSQQFPLLILFAAMELGAPRALTRGSQFVNLRVADDPLYGRPAVTEFAVRLQNLGNSRGVGEVSVDLVDGLGTVLITLDIPSHERVVGIPAYRLGGVEGRTIHLPRSTRLTSLVDSLIAAGVRYGLRATVATIGEDEDWSDNTKTRELGTTQTLIPAATTTLTRTFRNTTDNPWRARWQVDWLSAPYGVRLAGLPESGREIELQPGDSVTISLIARSLAEIAHGTVLSARISLIALASNRVLQQHELFAVFDSIAPVLGNYRAVVFANGMVGVQLMASDRHSEMDRRGVTTHYSLDEGRTWSSQVHTYYSDDFFRPAVFETFLGPIPRGSKILLSVTARDAAGNSQNEPPVDAAVIIAPRNAEYLIAVDSPFTVQSPNTAVFGPERFVKVQEHLNESRGAGDQFTRNERLKPDDFEKRRITDLVAMVAPLTKWQVDPYGFGVRHVDRVALRHGD
jgi:hypothetical protein